MANERIAAREQRLDSLESENAYQRGRSEALRGHLADEAMHNSQTQMEGALAGALAGILLERLLAEQELDQENTEAAARSSLPAGIRVEGSEDTIRSPYAKDKAPMPIKPKPPGSNTMVCTHTSKQFRIPPLKDQAAREGGSHAPSEDYRDGAIPRSRTSTRPFPPKW